MAPSIKNPSKRINNEPQPETQVSARNDIYKEEEVDEDMIKEEAARMDAMMRQLMGSNEEEDEQVEEEQEEKDAMEEYNPEEEDEGEFSFRLFANQSVATVTIADDKDTTDDLSKAIADQQEYEFDDTDPEFLERVNQAAIEYDTIMQQSTIPYPTLRMPRRVVHLNTANVDKVEKKTLKKRKSKKCRDFEKAVKEGKIVLKKNLRKSEDGWPGWPGNRTRVAIVDYDASKKTAKSNSRGAFRGGRGMSRGNSRGGSGGMMARGGRGGSGHHKSF